MKTVGFIGCGNMGSALAAAAAKSGVPLLVSDTDSKKAAELADRLGAKESTNTTIAESCDLIFLAVKPQILPGVLSDLAPVFASRKSRFTLVSMAAGVKIASIEDYSGGSYPVIRIMPNLPAACGTGMILYAPNTLAIEEDTEFLLKTLSPAGKLDLLPEKLIDAASAISGCGPAYVWMFAQAMADAGVSLGLSRDKALIYSLQTLLGSAQYALSSGEHPEKLKDMVCSPAGSTIEGVKALERNAFRAAVIEAVEEAYIRTLELGKKE